MPNPTLPALAIATDPGFLFWAPIGSTEPANTVAGSVFTDAWPGAWIVLGVTKDGHEFDWQTNTDKVEAAEYLDPLKYVSTDRTGSVKFELLNMTASNFKRMLNGGVLAVTGSGATQLNTYTPPPFGTEVRAMLGWESLDATERVIWRQCFNTGQLQTKRAKGANNASMPVEFTVELPTSLALPWSYLSAGTVRA